MYNIAMDACPRLLALPISCKYWESERGGQTCTTLVTDGGSKPNDDGCLRKKLLAVFGFSVDNSTIGCNCCSFCKEQCSCQQLLKYLT
jgi:hypothetical protein